MDIKLYLNSLKQKGNLAYKYSPFHNLQTELDLYEVNGSYIPKDKAINTLNGDILILKNGLWIDSHNQVVENKYVKTPSGNPVIIAGSLMDFDTELLNFDLEHPVDIVVQPSYDGSVNLILNDDKNTPRLINSRFSVKEKNTYEIVDRIGENDTNIYSLNKFDKDTSLYFQYETSVKIQFNKLISGNLPVGLYALYFNYCDADDNESDFIAESGLIPVFIGADGNVLSIDGGIKNQNSNKGISVTLNNINSGYNYLKVYYIRYFADYQQNRVVECKKILLKYNIQSDVMYLQITGDELTEDIDPNILNITRFNPKHVLTQALCKNMLFFGNIVLNTDNYRELTDCALRITPKIVKSLLNFMTFESVRDKASYYSSKNMYDKVGYMNNEYYRFGVVFIYENGTLSNVYNITGGILTDKTYTCTAPFETDDGTRVIRNYLKFDDKGWIDNLYFTEGSYLNSKGVCYMSYPESKFNEIYGIEFNIPQEVKSFLKEKLHIRGLFFVRLKRVPVVLAQCYLLPFDEVLRSPVIFNGNSYTTECFVTSEKKISHSLLSRLYKYTSKDSISTNAYAAICPDFLLNQPYYNQIFNGNSFTLQQVSSGANLSSSDGGRIFTMNNDFNFYERNTSAIITSVTEEVPSVATKGVIYQLNHGKAQEAYRYGFAEEEVTETTDESDGSVFEATNIVRGIYSPFLAIYSDVELNVNEIYNILQESSSNLREEFLVRMNSLEPFYAINDRYNFEEFGNTLECWRGDCYLNTFTFRLNRNFNDSTLPNNDKIIDTNTWSDNYTPDSKDKNPTEEFPEIYWPNISRSDINAILMGRWITINVKSDINYALRSIDHSHVAEEAEMGTPRTFYPKVSSPWIGDYKMPDSYLYNDAYRATLGFKCYYTLNNMNYIKDTFSNRIQYSAISIQDSFKNNYRYSLSTYYRDYSQEYGGIMRLIGFEGHLLVVFEHAIGLAVINERILAGQGDGDPVYINTKNVLPEELTIITDTYGTLWPESVIKTESGTVYGVDTIAKKIWRVKGQQIEILSDFKVNKFLIDNITLGERELYPIIGVRNVKTHYNNNKKDIMFTFYDKTTSWNLCYNEILNEFITFYSWIPSYSENIDTQYFSFNRNTSRGLALLNKCNYNIKGNTGVLLDSPVAKLSTVIINNKFAVLYKSTLKYIDPATNELVEDCMFKLPTVHSKMFEISGNELIYRGLFVGNNNVVITPVIPVINGVEYQVETVAMTAQLVIDNKLLTKRDKSKANLSTDFYLHGQSGIFDFKEPLRPTYWYDEQHPFEFEFVVTDKIGALKIYNNLIIISNKAEPESFHFTIEGDNYEFSADKRTMYFRLEATKETLSNIGSDITFDPKYSDIAADIYSKELYYRINHNDYPTLVEDSGLVQQFKSTVFPLYYNKVDTYNEIYHSYRLRTENGYDYKNLSGSEITWNKDLNQFNITTHIKNSPIDKVGRLRGNSYYKEGKWHVQIPSLIFSLKNEPSWTLPPLKIDVLPDDTHINAISYLDLPQSYKKKYSTIGEALVRDGWTNRKEARIRDKWIKIRVRYSGKNLAIIHSIITLYTVSNA